MRGSRGGDRGSGPHPLENHKDIGFLSNTGPDHEKSQSYQASIQSWVVIGMPVKRHLNVFNSIWISSSTKKKKLSGSAHISGPRREKTCLL